MFEKYTPIKKIDYFWKGLYIWIVIHIYVFLYLFFFLNNVQKCIAFKMKVINFEFLYPVEIWLVDIFLITGEIDAIPLSVHVIYLIVLDERFY